MTTIALRAPLSAVGGLTGLAVALALRVGVAGAAGAHSAVAGAVFGCALLAVAAACGFDRPALGWRPLCWGVAGAAVLIAPPLLHHLTDPGSGSPSGLLPVWATVVSLVAVAEEIVLRGTVFEALTEQCGPGVAIAVTAVAFALLHAPLYGWAVVPLDLAVGVFLGVLRAVAGSVTAPALTHTLADLAGWWLR